MTATTDSPRKAPGKSYREGISLIELFEMFPDEETARVWLEGEIWPTGRVCGHCGSKNTGEVSHKSMPYRCRDCKQYFSVKTGTALASSKVALRKWAIAIYLESSSLKGVSSMKLHRDLKVTQKTAWFMLHRIRTAFAPRPSAPFTAEVEVDETFVGGKAKNMHASQRAKLTGRGGADKTAVVGIKDRDSGKVVAEVVEATDADTLVPFVEGHTAETATVYTDGHKAYNALSRTHEVVEHSVGEYVRGMAHTNGIESFWSMLKRGYIGTYHHFSAKHLHRYVDEFSGRHNLREMDTLDQMSSVARGLRGQRIRYCDLVANPMPALAIPDGEPW
ncbi:MAG: IS1595 family transposase [Acidimicrobiales bacterium]|nr:IS1595 family transposase [Acidimicrobiales bacterium]MYJ64013.1 IS1595 family transposase [Acidimicrobiales bacterium]